jgi:hypothetical protein
MFHVEQFCAAALAIRAMVLFVFATVFFARAGLGEIRVVVFQVFILVAVAELAMDVRIVRTGLRRFLLDCPFGSVAVVAMGISHGGDG